MSPACLPVSPSLCGQMPDAVTPAPGSCLPLVSLCLPVSMPDAVDAGSRVVSPGCLPVSPSQCDQMPDTVTQAAGRVSRVSPKCLPSVSQSPWSDARCCDAGSGVVSPACLSASPSLCGRMLWGRVSRLSPCVFMPDAVTLASGLCLPLVSLCLPSPVFFGNDQPFLKGHGDSSLRSTLK